MIQDWKKKFKSHMDEFLSQGKALLKNKEKPLFFDGNGGSRRNMILKPEGIRHR